jgi:hypothetical protein
MNNSKNIYNNLRLFPNKPVGTMGKFFGEKTREEKSCATVPLTTLAAAQ